MTLDLEKIKTQVQTGLKELLAQANLEAGDIFVLGCSTSEIQGEHIGKDSNIEVGRTVIAALLEILRPLQINLAVQGCEHLNRAIIAERAAVPFYDIVNVVPQPKAGGSFATAAYAAFDDPVAVEEIRADAGLDIGFTMIGMHLKKVAVPVRLQNNKIGEATVLAARVRPKFIGGERARYDEDLE